MRKFLTGLMPIQNRDADPDPIGAGKVFQAAAGAKAKNPRILSIGLIEGPGNPNCRSCSKP